MPPPPGSPSERERRRAYERTRAQRRRQLRRRRQIAGALAALAIVGVAALIALVALPALKGAGSRPGDQLGSGTHRTVVQVTTSSTTSHPAPPPGPPYAVGVETLRFEDTSRTVTYRNGTTAPRVINTEVRYPAVGQPGEYAIKEATPQRASGPFPLIVFGHGFALMPVEYHRLLNAWAAAGYVVAAPIFPAENKDAPGGPDEEDLPNQPGDMKFVAEQMKAEDQSPESAFNGLIDTEELAVAGHSDGGDTALAVAYDEYQGLRDPEVKAAVILSGAEMRAYPTISFPSEGPPLLAMQGTLDKINSLAETEAYFQAAPPPKFLLELTGAEHLPPYTYQEPQLKIVTRVSIDFLNHYLKQRKGSLAAMSAAGKVSGVASLQADR